MTKREAWRDCDNVWEFLAFMFTKRRRETWMFLTLASVVFNIALLLKYTDLLNFLMEKFL